MQHTKTTERQKQSDKKKHKLLTYTSKWVDSKYY